MIGLPPGVTTTWAGSTAIPRGCATSAAIASRSSRDARGRGVVGLAVAQRPAPGLDHVLRRVEVGLADLQVDDLPPLRLQRPRLRQHRERRLRPQARHPLRQLHPTPPLPGTGTRFPLHHTPKLWPAARPTPRPHEHLALSYISEERLEFLDARKITETSEWYGITEEVSSRRGDEYGVDRSEQRGNEAGVERDAG